MLKLLLYACICCLLVVLIPLGLAQPQIDDVTVLTDIVDTSSFVTYTFFVHQEPCVETVSFTVPVGSTLVTAFSPQSSLSVAIANTTATVTLPSCVQGTVEFFIKVRSASAVTLSEGLRQVTLFSPFSVPTTHRLLLPAQTQESDIISVYPDTYRLLQLDVPTIEWQTNTSTQYVVQLRQTEQRSTWFYLVAAILAVFVLIGVFALLLLFVIRPLREKWRVEQTLKKCKVLQEKEQEIMRHIIMHPGVYQHTLIKELQLLKSNGSKLISKLEQRGLITRKRLGKINALYPGERLR